MELRDNGKGEVMTTMTTIEPETICKLEDVPEGWSFCKTWDGWNASYDRRDFHPMHTYQLLSGGWVVSLEGAGDRMWLPSGVGLKFSDPVRIFRFTGRYLHS